IFQRHAVADVGGRQRAIFDLIARLQTLWRDDVSLLSVGVMQQSHVGTAIRIVLHGMHPRNHAVLITLEVDNPQRTLMAATAMASGNDTGVVPPPLLLSASDQMLIRFGSASQIRKVA